MSPTTERPRMLVPFDGSAAAERVLRTACQASLEDYASLVVLCVVPIPVDGSIEAPPREAEAKVMRTLVRAMDVCREEGVLATFRETYAPDLAEEILRIADHTQAAVIAMPLDDETPGDTRLMSPTVQRVLAGAHCTVMLEPDRPAAIEDEISVNRGS